MRRGRGLDLAQKRAMEALLNAEEEITENEVPPAQDSGYYTLGIQMGT
jgi:hypothetical protein